MECIRSLASAVPCGLTTTNFEGRRMADKVQSLGVKFAASPAATDGGSGSIGK